MTPHPVHAVVLDNPGSHRADRYCPCGPKVLADLNEPARLVFVHRSLVIAKPPRKRASRAWLPESAA